ncbi:MAG: DUF1152 domain-containing protein [Planctomycetota bacterium]
MPLGQSRLFDYFDSAKRVLVAGAGGGCDIYCGLPFFFALRERGAEVHLANLTFANQYQSKRITDDLFEAHADDDGPEYGPERYLAAWLKQQEIEMPVYAFARTGVKPITEAYAKLVEMLDIDAILLVDGGTDSLMRGDEFHLATPQEDVASIVAASQTKVDRKALVCTAFGVDAFHGICHAQFLENMAHFMQHGGYLGTFSMDAEYPEVQAYLNAVVDLCRRQPAYHSIVNTSMRSAIEGHYGDHHTSHRTAGSKLWINPLMSLGWAFELDAVAKRILYRKQIVQTESYCDLNAEINKFRAGIYDDRRDFEDIPV